MQAIVLAAGQGKRLHPLTEKKPKPLVEVLNKPLLEYVLDVLVPYVTEVIIVTGYKDKAIKKHIGNMYRDTKITYVQQDERLGTGHALMLCKKYVTGDFILMYGDEIVDEEAIANLAQHTAAALAYRRDDPENFGVIVHDKEMNLLNIEEKPKKPESNLVSAAAFKLTRKIFLHYPPPEKNGEYYLADMIPSYLNTQPMKVVEAHQWLTVNRPEDIKTAERELKKNHKL